MKYTALTLPIVLLGCPAQMPAPVQPESVQCAPERTLQDEANAIYVTLSTRRVKGQIISYGDLSHYFEVRATDVNNGSCDYDTCGLRFDLYKGDSFLGDQVFLRFEDSAPLGSLDYVLICQKNGNLTYERCKPLLKMKDVELLHETHAGLMKTAVNHFNNQRDLLLELELVIAYSVIMVKEGY